MCFLSLTIIKLIEQVIIEATLIIALIRTLINQVTQHTQETPTLVLGIGVWFNGGALDPCEVRINLLDGEVDDVIHRYVGQLGVTLANIFVLDAVLEQLV